ncbi:MAG: hypothetical protein ACRC8U_06485, partial [Brooklawnia sp.]
MSATTTAKATTAIELKTSKDAPTPQPSRPALLWQGARSTIRVYRRWRTAQDYIELRELARADKQWTHVTWWDRQATAA